MSYQRFNSKPNSSGKNFAESFIEDEMMKEIEKPYTAESDLVARTFDPSDLAYGIPRKNQSKSPNPYGSAQQLARNKYASAVWAEGVGELIHQNRAADIPSYSAKSAGCLFGYDRYFEEAAASAGIGYVRTWLNEGGNAGRAEIDAYAAFLYGTYYHDNFYVELGFIAAGNDFRNRRNVTYPGFAATAKSSHWCAQAVPHVGLGYDISWKSATLEPFVSFDASILYQSAFSEHGAGTLNMTQKSTLSELLQTEAGFNAYEIVTRKDFEFIFRQKLSYINKQPINIGHIEAALVGFPFGFTVTSFNKNQNLLSPALQIFFRKNNGFFASLMYNGQFQIGDEGYISNEILLKLGRYF